MDVIPTYQAGYLPHKFIYIQLYSKNYVRFYGDGGICVCLKNIKDCVKMLGSRIPPQIWLCTSSQYKEESLSIYDVMRINQLVRIYLSVSEASK